MFFLQYLKVQKKRLSKNLQIYKRNDLNAIEKSNLITKLEFDLNRKQDPLYLQLHTEKNVGIHQKFIITVINKLIPIYTAVISQGVKEGLFNTPYPRESAEYIIIATKFMFDPGIFPINLKTLRQKSEASKDIAEKILGAKKGSLCSPDITCLLKGEN